MSLTPSLLVPGIVEEMANYYVDVFPDGELLGMMRSSLPTGGDAVITANIRIHDTDVLFVSGGPEYNMEFNESFSLTIPCETQDDVDHFWNRFVGDGGREIDCGWCADKYGVRWQVVPNELPQLLSDPDPERANAAMGAMMTMKKIDINAIKAAVEEAGTA